jgi:hypothetical protein
MLANNRASASYQKEERLVSKSSKQEQEEEVVCSCNSKRKRSSADATGTINSRTHAQQRLHHI